MTPPQPESDRLTRLEAVVERLESVVERIAEREGRPNWNMLGVLATVVIAVGAACAAVIFGPIQNNATNIAEVKAELQLAIQREMERNNRLEREMGAVLKVDELFQLGRLRLE